MRLSAILACLSLLPLTLAAQNMNDAMQSVIIQAQVQETPPRITLNWVADAQNSGYTIYRKAKTANGWGTQIGSALSFETTWADTNVVVGQTYEYRINKNLAGYGGGSSNGYIYAGIKANVQSTQVCLVVVDSTFKESLADEISQLGYDLRMDGWSASTLYVDRNDEVTTVRNLIKTWANQHPADSRAVFLLGHVPVPYSGQIAPDGHTPDHLGAWPCDGYYAEIDGIWTDQSVNTTEPNDPRNDNTPGDGKFDQSVFPGKVELQVGRVDFANMPAFAQSEEALLRRYLHKDHAWRTGMAPAQERGLIQNNFAGFAEGFGQNGWKNFSTMFGYENTAELPYRSTLLANNYLWSYGCGAGSYTTSSGITTTDNLANDSLQTVFTMLFGSYFGDWDKTNNLLRAGIASGATLSNAWAARPNWMFHHMALGENIGFAALITMNNNGTTYQSGYGASSVHIALMGDPTLTMHIMRPVNNVVATADGQHVHIQWEANDPALGYMVYKRMDGDAFPVALNTDPVTALSFTDSCAANGLTEYIIRGVELRTSASGSYWHYGHGASTWLDVDHSALDVQAAFVAVPYFDEVSFDNASVNGLTYTWDLGDGQVSTEESPVHFYTPPTTYTVCLVAEDLCFQSIDCQQVTLINSLPTIQAMVQDATCYGSPTGSVHLNPTGGTPGLTISWDNAPDTDLSLDGVPAGSYTCTIISETGKTGTYGPYTVGQPDELVLTATTTPADPGMNNGHITANVDGGCQPYTYAWSNGITTPDPGDLPAGTYCLTITDCQGCTTDTCVTVEELSSTVLPAGLLEARITPNPVGERATIDLTFGSPGEVVLTVLNSLGQEVRTLRHRGSRITAFLEVSAMAPGRYWIRITTDSGSGILPFEVVR